LGLLAWVSAAAADEQKVALKDLPKAVVDAVKARFPAAEMKEASKETEDGKTTYEVSIEDKGKTVDISATIEGKITAIETKIAAADLPAAVAQAIEAKYPKATVQKAEQIVEFEGSNESQSYEVVLKTEAKKAIEVKLSPEGKILKTEEGDDDNDQEKK
jgi:hypothetical protein